MKKFIVLLTAFMMTFSLAGCNQSEPSGQPNSSENSYVNGTTSVSPNENSSQQTESDNSTTEPVSNVESTSDSTAQTPITLTVGEIVLNGYLNDSLPAQSLIAQLPLTVSLNDSDNDFCGGNLDIEYSESDVTSGYNNGDLSFWTPANNFVIFVSGEENSADTGNLVKLGRITDPQESLDKLEGRIDVTIALSNNTDYEQTSDSENSGTDVQEGEEAMKIRITVGNTELYATMEDNSTTRELMAQMPMTLSMSDLYGREMCYRYGAGTFPTDNLRSDGYEIGDIAYWPPRGSLVILYDQNGEHFERQHLGHIDSGVEVFESTGDVDVTFEVVS